MPIDYDLQNAIMEPDADVDTILACLRNRFDTAVEEQRPTQLLNDYFQHERDWNNFVAARNWWLKLKKLPPRLTWRQVVYSAVSTYCMKSLTPGTDTMMGMLARVAEQVKQYYIASGADPEHPTEDRAERMRRLNRERVAAHRARQRDGTATPQDSTTERSAAAVAWDAVVDARNARKRVRAEQDALVAAAYKAMEDAASERKRVMAEYDQAVTAAEEAHRQAKAT